ncbi:MAG: flavin reductase family protein, partial [Cutibacterium granulosum]|nr:flavin reductase family protein [Cutibacterium granulosum]
MSRDVRASGEPPAGGELPIDAQPSLGHAQQLKEQLATAFRHHPAGAAIITVNGANGPEGLTASSLISVAVEPAIIVFSAGRTTSTSRQLT